jgi:hypothetical protein
MPVFNEKCLRVFRITPSGSMVTVSTNAVAEDSICKLTVTVGDMTETRFAQSTVSIQVSSNSSTVVNVDSNVPSTIMNPSQSMRLTGTVSA